MKATKTIREKLGLNQEQMAQWLGISRSHLANYERGQRSLPAHALLQLGKLEIMMKDLQKRNPPKTKQPVDAGKAQRHKAAKQKFQLYAKKYLLQVREMGHKLKAIKQRHEQAQQLASIINKLTAETPNEKKNNKQVLWLQMQQYFVANKLKKCDEVAQMKMQAKMEIFEMMGKIHERFGNLEI